ncbi:MAG: filamentous hemagglutinin N-terminal domain-containing protein [Leptolyngbya sp. SIOISBB]|nr:filamentous hemagglutinin N-terminal domain-containing protein [Leptolyngbya sp. SIOISBB]
MSSTIEESSLEQSATGVSATSSISAVTAEPQFAPPAHENESVNLDIGGDESIEDNGRIVALPSESPVDVELAAAERSFKQRIDDISAIHSEASSPVETPQVGSLGTEATLEADVDERVEETPNVIPPFAQPRVFLPGEEISEDAIETSTTVVDSQQTQEGAIVSSPSSAPEVLTTQFPDTLQEVLIAQIVPDSTLGSEASIVIPDVTVGGELADQIEGGAIRGSNLFHSFEDFNVNTGQQVYFANPIGIENILSRVTGNSVSDIDGLLGVDGGANLFLLNPNGIIFGPNARLDVSGSFTASTAENFSFADGSEFSATSPDESLLTLSLPLGVQFNGPALGNITNSGILETDLTLSLLGHQLSLEGQILAGQDLMLQGQDVVTIRDTSTEAFVASAGDDLIIQGNQQVDIFALNHPESGLFSGRDLVVRSDNPVIGDARFYGGGNLRIESLDGSSGNLLSPHDPIILTSGNVSLGNYTGASLHILAGGSVTLGSVTINGAGRIDSTINPANPLLFNGNQSYADLANFTVSEYATTANIDGTVTQVPIQKTITVDGSARATLDIRAGVDWAALGGLPLNPTVINGVPLAPTYPVNALSSEITITGAVGIAQGDNQVVLTNQFQPNIDLAAGEIKVGSIDTAALLPNLDGGSISIYGRGDITTAGVLNSSALSFGNAGEGGAISIVSEFGDVTINDNVNSNSLSLIAGDAGAGGTISIASQSGDIVTNGSLISSSITAVGDSGLGGDISISSQSGNINTGGVLLSSSSANQGNAGTAGNISISSQSGNINTGELLSSSSASIQQGNAGAGGDISISSQSGNINTGGVLLSSSSANQGNAGTAGNISISSQSGNINTGELLSSSSASIQQGNAGAGGDISISSQSGNINTGGVLGSSTLANQGNAGAGGDISIASQSGNITTNELLTSGSGSEGGDAGNGGAISITSRSGDILINGTPANPTNLSEAVLSTSTAEGGGDAGNGGDIRVISQSGDIFISGRLVSTSVSEIGNAGTGGAISIISQSGNIDTDSNLDSFSFSFLRENNARAGGDITISAPAGYIQGRNNRLLTFAAVQDRGESGEGGNVLLRAGNTLSGLEIVTLSSTDESGSVQIEGLDNLLIQDVRLTTTAQAEFLLGGQTIPLNTAGFGPSGNVFVTSAGNLTFNSVEIQANANGNTPAGDINIDSPGQVTFNNSRIDSNTNSTGTAGNISITTGTGITLHGNSSIFARTARDGQGGDIQLNTPSLTFANGGEISASTFGQGNGGSLTIQSNGSLLIQGDGRLTVEAQGVSSGRAGVLNVQASSLELNDNIELFASSESSRGGGDVEITVDNLFLMRGGSFINAESTNPNAGNGGNIFIDTSDGFLIAIPGQNSDIVANAVGGDGGRVEISALDILGFTEQDGLTTAELRDNSTNDLSASSQDGVQGTISLNTLDLEPDQGLIELPSLSPSPPIQRGCSTEVVGTSSFTVTGRGGLPPSPTDILSRDRILTDLGPESGASGASTQTAIDESAAIVDESPAYVVEAQGFIKDNNGQITFLAQVPEVTGHVSGQPLVQCSGTTTNGI